MEMINFVLKLIKWMFVISLGVTLVDEVRFMMNKAAHATKHGYISLSSLAKATTGYSKPQKKK